MNLRVVSLFSILLFLSACSLSNSSEESLNYSFELVDQIILDPNKIKDESVLGGLSSIDYLGSNQYIIISDDRSEYSDARLYKLQIQFSEEGIENYEFLNTIYLKNELNNRFSQDELDPESIRYRKNSNSYFITSEGGRIGGYIDPFIWEINKNGEFLRNIETPSLFRFYEDKGVRKNGAFESLSFENDTIIWYVNELPLIQDGMSPGFTKGSYPLRLVRHDIKNNKVLAQYAYQIEPLQKKPIPEDGFYINSVPEILWIDDNTLWVMERSYTTGVGNFVRVYQVNTSKASDIQNIEYLEGSEFNSVSKRLVLDFSDYNLRIDNIEGLTFGPNFPDGSKSVLFISDDNFNKDQETQLWLFSLKTE
ncbi:esterase-like activity of phytase family protein [Marivirga arenosa]|uniref:Esterase-like activity of phytase family protein n=1 Tax=Marivirga arenosa TaxID=3059076 RepID=A0AA51N8N0_9BACT|nr:esterase-like activity of phytase family protein [Marivirga sp. ABR2-2]WMN06540.1 esterase-like activity of phytase family protein [Marivirga sp. ABR2-2]